MQGSIWEVDHPVARLCRGELQARVNVLTPECGLDSLLVAGVLHRGSIQRVVFTADETGDRAKLSDLYVRGTDLIANYTQAKRQPFRAKVYWRSLSTDDNPTAQAVIDVMVSLETHLLESRPRVTIEAAVPVREVFALDGRPLKPAATMRLAAPLHNAMDRPQGCVLRLADVDRSVAPLVRPDDACEVTAQWDTEGWLRVVHQLSCDPLEKGVILRARVRSVWGCGDVALADACAWYDALVREKLPLTA